MALYGTLAARLEVLHPGSDLGAIKAAPDAEAMLAAVGARYLETGLAGLREVPEASCDMVFSQAVLEHVPREQFAETIRETYRILKPGGVSSHQIDFRDHLGGELNNLRFPASLWEESWFARRSGFYTNRLRYSEMMALFEEAGFNVTVACQQKWPVCPIARCKLSPEFRDLSEDDLTTWDIVALLQRPVGRRSK